MDYKLKYLIIFVVLFIGCFIFGEIVPSAVGKEIRIPIVVTVISGFLYGFTFAFMSLFAYVIHFFGIKKFLVEHEIILFSLGLLFYALLGWMVGFIIQYLSSLLKKVKKS